MRNSGCGAAGPGVDVSVAAVTLRYIRNRSGNEGSGFGVRGSGKSKGEVPVERHGMSPRNEAIDLMLVQKQQQVESSDTAESDEGRCVGADRHSGAVSRATSAGVSESSSQP
jgi:hypothetical protein